MAEKQTIATPAPPVNRRPNSAEQRAARAELLTTKLASLKQEAADRRAQRERQTALDASAARPASGATRSGSL